MLISDAALPAAAHLVGPDAVDVLRPPVEASGGRIESARACGVQYRPGSDVTVRYTAQIAWGGGAPRRETLVASTTTRGTPPGTAVVTADTPAGRLDVGVWRWPFDPVLHGLAAAVTPTSVAQLLGSPGDTGLELDVVAYRPTERAVVRVRDAGATTYLKVVDPEEAARLARVHAGLRDAGVPAPRVRHADERGILVLDEVPGTTLRELIKAGTGTWPAPTAFDALADAFASVDPERAGAPSKAADGILHASMLATVLPRHRARLEELAGLLRELGVPPATTTIHGDLHEGQLVVDDGVITGVVDVDDVGPGDPVDDRANLVARLRFRAVTTPDAAARLDGYGDELRLASADRFGLERLDVTTAAALVGLATGPFRIQQPGWRASIDALLHEAERILTQRGQIDAKRRDFSSGPHPPLTDACP